MNSSHTPGPWIIWDNIIVDQRREPIAQIFKQSNDFPLKKTPEADANASLIAASPELFIALQKMLAVFKDHEQYDEDSAAAVKLARSAIQKTKQ